MADEFRTRRKGFQFRRLLPAAGALFLASRTVLVLSFTVIRRSPRRTPLVRRGNPDTTRRECGFGRKRKGCLCAQNKNTDAVRPPPAAHIVFPGGGIYYYHQAGVIEFLRGRYDLSACTFAGASAGALTATLAAADVDFREATALALALAKRAGVWERQGGLQGIWGALIEEWLDALLPTDIDPLQDRIALLVTPVPSFGKTQISRFEDRKDLICCNMASIHLPWFLDGNLTSNFRGRPHIDGSFLSKESDYAPNFEGGGTSPANIIVLDWSEDPTMSSKGGMDIVGVLSPEGIYGLMEQGYRYGKLMEDRGAFNHLPHLP